MSRKVNKARSAVSNTDRLRSWLRHHREALRTGVGYVMKEPLSSALMLFSMSVALALPSALYLGMSSVSGNTTQTGSGTISAFTQVSLDNAAINRLAETIHIRPDVEGVEIISREQALKQLSENSDLKDVLGTLKENPLPATLLVRVRDSASSREAITQLANDIRNIKGIAETTVDTEWLHKIHTLGSSVRTISVVFGLGLAMMLALLIHIALRSEILERRAEIEVVKLVGGSDEYIERPFVYFALIYGLLATLLSILWLALAFAYMQTHIDAVTTLYSQSFNLRIPGMFAIGLIISMMIFTMVTATLTVRSLTYSIEPG